MIPLRRGGGQSGSEVKRGGKQVWLLPAIAVVFVLFAAFTIGALNDMVGEGGEVPVLPESIEGDAAQQGILERRIIAEGEARPEAVRELAERRAGIGETPQWLSRLATGGADVDRVRAALDVYRTAMDEEVRRLEAGSAEEARALNVEMGGGVFEAPRWLLQGAAEGYEAAAVQADLTVYAGMMYVVVLSLVLLAVSLAVLFWVFARARREDQKALKESEERYRLVTRATNETIWDVDLRPGGELRWHGAAESRFGYSVEEPKRGPWWEERVHPEDWGRVISSMDVVMRGDADVWTDEYRFRCGDGGYAWVVDRGYVVRDASGEPVRMIGSMADVTERRRAEEALRESEQRFRGAFASSSTGIALVGLDGRWLEVNRALCGIVGYTEEELLSKTFQDITHPDDLERDLDHVRRLISGEIENYQMEKRYLHKLGHQVWILLSVSLVRDASGEPLYFVAQVQDINDRKDLEERLAHRAFHDALTGLPNRALFVNRLEHALIRADRRDHSVAVLFVDLDDFKLINDSLGHEAGDRLLVAFAERLEDRMRVEDTAARLGGDEFTVLLEDVSDVSEPVRVAQRIVECLSEPFTIEGNEVSVSASVGIALTARGDGAVSESGDPEGATLRSEDLIRRADLAMYRVKRKGKAGYEVYDASMNDAARERLQMEGDLRRALERGEFRVHYQPQVLLKGGAPVGVEALVRWEHPERGPVSPAAFVPVAEETGLIVPIGRFVLREACRQVVEWKDASPGGFPSGGLAVGVNLSAKQFQQKDLVHDVSRVLEETGLPPGDLILEVSESVAMNDAPLTEKVMRELKSLGVRLSIDDFGTGYSSLSYLKRFPADYLKIDRSFVDGLGRDPEEAAIVSAMVNLSHDLDLKVVAEGIETTEQLDVLREMGCELGQGYHFSEPLDAAGAVSLLASTRQTMRRS